MDQRTWTRQRKVVVSVAAVVALLGPGSVGSPVEAKPKPYYCDSSDDWDERTTARGWCYPGTETKDLRLYVRCQGEEKQFHHEAKFDKEMDIRMGVKRPPMRVKAAEYKCGNRKVIEHFVAAKNFWA